MTGVADQGNLCKRNGKQNVCPLPNKAYICIAVLFLITVGLMAALIWTISDTGQQSDSYNSRISVLKEELLIQEKKNDKYISRIEALEKQLLNKVTAVGTSPAIELVSASSKTSTSLLSTIISPQMATTTTMADTSTSAAILRSTTMSTTSMTTVSPSRSTTTLASYTTESPTTPVTTLITTTGDTTTISQTGQAPNTSFNVLQTQEVTYNNFTFLAMQVEVPSDGNSTSENWCRDYQYLCEHFSRRPTGCGSINHINISPYKDCRVTYNSDMDIDGVLGCSPSSKVADIANIAFPTSLPPAKSPRNAFGFFQCSNSRCQTTIQASDLSLSYMRGFWENSDTIMYTLCR